MGTLSTKCTVGQILGSKVYRHIFVMDKCLSAKWFLTKRFGAAKVPII